MRRRDFLRTTIALAPMIMGRRALSQTPTQVTRAAVVIGVNKCGNLPVLRAAGAGARDVARWLADEGFVVKPFLDDGGPVKADPIYEAVEKLMDLGTLEQLVIYFSGHGFQTGFTEHWFLSDAPRNPNASISIVECIELARFCGIPNVVFISDACRSTSASLGVQQMHGSFIFPSASRQKKGAVDVFYAALPGDPALELPVEESTKNFEGIFTRAFLRAYEYPTRDMIKTVRGNQVIPNRFLEPYLVNEVKKMAEAKSIRLRQEPDARVLSDETVYIGRYRTKLAAGDPVTGVIGKGGGMGGAILRPPPPPPRDATIADVARVELARVGAVPTAGDSQANANMVAALSEKSGFSAAVSTVAEASRPKAGIPDHFETQTGFIVHGARVVDVATSLPEMHVERLEEGDGNARPAILRLRPVPGTTLIRFGDGSGAVLASLPGYIGTLIVKDGSVVNVSYLPSRNSSQWHEEGVAGLRELRAVVAASAQYGVFRIEGNESERSRSAAQLADRIRVLKGIDPTLGIYAAYAYSDAGLIDQVRSVHRIMRSDLGTDLFDVAMLAGRLSGASWGSRDVVPVCPLLSQGWSLLRVRGVRLPQSVEAARSYLGPGLWTTFAPEGINILRRTFP